MGLVALACGIGIELVSLALQWFLTMKPEKAPSCHFLLSFLISKWLPANPPKWFKVQSSTKCCCCPPKFPFFLESWPLGPHGFETLSCLQRNNICIYIVWLFLLFNWSATHLSINMRKIIIYMILMHICTCKMGIIMLKIIVRLKSDHHGKHWETEKLCKYQSIIIILV